LAAEGKVFYVWFDAPIEYIGATIEWSEETAGFKRSVCSTQVEPWRKWWIVCDGADQLTYTQFMAKDNVPFHTVMFPATILGTREPWKLVDYVKGFSWLNYYGGKFSTSQKRGIFTDAALELWPSDYWRYYLISNAPEADDADFTWENFAAIVNKDLADTLGNFVNRVLTFTAKKFGNTVPAGGEPGEAEQRLFAKVSDLLHDLESALDAMEFRKATHASRALWSAGNGYLVECEPWKRIKTDPDAAACALRTAIGLIRLYGIVSAPFIPATAATLRGVLDQESSECPGWVGQVSDCFESLAGRDFTVPPVLFAKVTDDDVAQAVARFGGAN
jgi:methionyl-tRNA synthetase